MTILFSVLHIETILLALEKIHIFVNRIQPKQGGKAETLLRSEYKRKVLRKTVDSDWHGI